MVPRRSGVSPASRLYETSSRRVTDIIAEQLALRREVGGATIPPPHLCISCWRPRAYVWFSAAMANSNRKVTQYAPTVIDSRPGGPVCLEYSPVAARAVQIPLTTTADVRLPVGEGTEQEVTGGKRASARVFGASPRLSAPGVQVSVDYGSTDRIHLRRALTVWCRRQAQEAPRESGKAGTNEHAGRHRLAIHPPSCAVRTSVGRSRETTTIDLLRLPHEQPGIWLAVLVKGVRT